MKMRRILASSLAVTLFAVTIGMAGASAKAGDVNLTAKLAGAAIKGMVPKGIAEFRSRADGSRQLKVQIENTNLAGATLNVLINNEKVGELTVSAFLAGEMQLNTRDNQAVPPVGSGSTAVVTDQAGTTIVAGTF